MGEYNTNARRLAAWRNGRYRCKPPGHYAATHHFAHAAALILALVVDEMYPKLPHDGRTAEEIFDLVAGNFPLLDDYRECEFQEALRRVRIAEGGAGTIVEAMMGGRDD